MLDEVIRELSKLREQIGHDCKIFMPGWNDSGIVQYKKLSIIFVVRTKYELDGEVVRIFEEAKEGEAAVYIQP